MWYELTPDQIVKTGIPALYETEAVPLTEKTIYLHYFIEACDWYMAEYDRNKDLFFGFANLGDPQMAEWGYISHKELKDISIPPGIEVDRDIHWKPRRVSDIEKIVACM